MRITLVCITLLFSPWIFANEFDWAYRGFLYSFEARQFEDLEPFFAENTLLGFGPAEVGYSTFLQKYEEDGACFRKMLNALQLGCRLSSERNSCVAPPLADDSDVIGIEARAHFVFVDGNFRVSSFICNGDSSSKLKK